MENLEYFEITDDGTVFVRERSTEFFALYSPQTKKWCQPDNFTFMQLIHDRNFRKISKEDALQKTDGCAPEALFSEYVSLLKGNL